MIFFLSILSQVLLLCNILSITKKISSSIIFFLNYLSGEREGGDKQQQQSCKTNVGCGIVCDRSVTHSQCRGFDALSGSLCLLNLFALRNLKKKSSHICPAVNVLLKFSQSMHRSDYSK